MFKVNSFIVGDGPVNTDNGRLTGSARSGYPGARRAGSGSTLEYPKTRGHFIHLRRSVPSRCVHVPIGKKEQARKNGPVSFDRLAEREGFEPPCRLLGKTLSRRPRYDHFGTSPLFGARSRPFGPVPSGCSLTLASFRSPFVGCSIPLAFVPVAAARLTDLNPQPAIRQSPVTSRQSVNR